MTKFIEKIVLLQLVAIFPFFLNCKSRVASDLVSAGDGASEVAKFLSENNISEDLVQEIIQRELISGSEGSVPNIWVLGVGDVLTESEITPEAIQGILQREKNARNGALLGGGLALAGVACIFVPLPGARVVSLIFIKNGLALAAATYAVSAATRFAQAKDLETLDRKRIAELLVMALNRLIQKTPARFLVDEVIAVKLDSTKLISGFTTKSGQIFKQKTIGDYENYFVVNVGGFIRPDMRVLSMVDGQLIAEDRYITELKHINIANNLNKLFFDELPRKEVSLLEVINTYHRLEPQVQILLGKIARPNPDNFYRSWFERTQEKKRELFENLRIQFKNGLIESLEWSVENHRAAYEILDDFALLRKFLLYPSPKLNN